MEFFNYMLAHIMYSAFGTLVLSWFLSLFLYRGKKAEKIMFILNSVSLSIFLRAMIFFFEVMFGFYS